MTQLELNGIVSLVRLPAKKSRGPRKAKRDDRRTRAKEKSRTQAPLRKATATSAVETQWAKVRSAGDHERKYLSERVAYVLGDAAEWVASLPSHSIHAVVTDPPYGLIEYNETNHTKMLNGRGGVWRIPPAYDGAHRQPLPRFTVLSEAEREALTRFFVGMATALMRVLAPGGHIFIASNPLLSSQTFVAFLQAGFEKRGEVIRLVQTLRGGDRPKNAHDEFPDVSMMPRSCWEPWGVFRKPMDGPTPVSWTVEVLGSGYRV